MAIDFSKELKQQFWQLVYEAKDAGVEDDFVIRSLFKEWSLKKRDKTFPGRIRDAIQYQRNKMRLERQDPLYPIPAQAQFPKCEVGLGHIVRLRKGKFVRTDVHAGLPLNDLYHTLLVGMTRCGKTYLLMAILRSICIACLQKAQAFGIWIVEAAKHDLKSIVVLLGKLGVPVLVVDWKTGLKLNPLEVPRGVSPKIWAGTVCEIFVDAYQLSEPAFDLLRRAIVAAYEQTGVFRGETEYPVIRELCQFITNFDGAHAQTKQKLLRVVYGLLDTLGESLDYRRGYTEQLERHVVLFELAGLPTRDVTLITNLLLTSASMRRSENYNDEHAPLYIACEEFKPVLVTASEHSYWARLADQAAAGGIKFIWLSQPSTQLSKTCLNASALKIMGASGKKALHWFGEVMGLSSSMISALGRHQRDRIFAVAHQQGRGPRNYVIESPHVPIPSTVRSSDLALGKEILDSLVLQPATTPLEIVRPDECASVQPEAIKSPATLNGPGQSQPFAPLQLPAEELKYLSVVAANPDGQLTVIDKENDITISKGHALRKSLIARDYIQLHEVKTGDKKSYKIAAVSPIGAPLLPEEIRTALEALPRLRGGPVHSHKARIISAALASEFKLSLEHRLPAGGSIDIHASRASDGRSFAIEIEENPFKDTGVQIRKNVLKCVEAGTPEVYLIVPTKHLLRRVKKALADILRQHRGVSVSTLSEFRSLSW